MGKNNLLAELTFKCEDSMVIVNLYIRVLFFYVFLGGVRENYDSEIT